MKHLKRQIERFERFWEFPRQPGEFETLFLDPVRRNAFFLAKLPALAFLGVDVRELTAERCQVAPLREGKGFYYEGGIRVPLLVRYPAMTTPRSTLQDVVASIDYVPTLREVAQLTKKKDVDGRSFVSTLKGKSPKETRTI